MDELPEWMKTAAKGMMTPGYREPTPYKPKVRPKNALRDAGEGCDCDAEHYNGKCVDPRTISQRFDGHPERPRAEPHG